MRNFKLNYYNDYTMEHKKVSTTCYGVTFLTGNSIVILHSDGALGGCLMDYDNVNFIKQIHFKICVFL